MKRHISVSCSLESLNLFSVTKTNIYIVELRNCRGKNTLKTIKQSLLIIIIRKSAFSIFCCSSTFHSKSNSKNIVTAINMPPFVPSTVFRFTLNPLTTSVEKHRTVTAASNVFTVVSDGHKHEFHLQFYMLLIAANNFEIEFHQSQSN